MDSDCWFRDDEVRADPPPGGWLGDDRAWRAGAAPAARDVTGCDRVYQWATMDRYPHFHTRLVPWWDAGGLRGPGYLAAVVDLEPDESATLATAARLRAAVRG